MARIRWVAIAGFMGMLVSLGGCAEAHLGPAYGLSYNDLFTAQTLDHPSHEVWPVHGEEAKRVIGSFYQSIAPDDQSGGGSVTQSITQGITHGAAPGVSSFGKSGGSR